MSTVRAVCWDWNGTLLDDVAVCLEVMNAVLEEHEVAPLADAAAYRAAFRFPIRGFYQDMGIGDDHFEPAARRYLHLLAQRTGEAPLHRGAHETIAALSDLGIRQVLASATLPEPLRAQMAPHGIDACFEAVLSIPDALRPSKHDVIATWLAGSGLRPGELLMIGDTNHDQEIAASLGAQFVHYDGGHQRLATDGARIAELPELVSVVTAG